MENGLHGHRGQVAVLIVEGVVKPVSGIAPILNQHMVEDFVQGIIQKLQLVMISHVLMVSLAIKKKIIIQSKNWNKVNNS